MAVVSGLIALWVGGVIHGSHVFGFVGGGGVVAVVGFIDDHADVPPAARAAVQSAAAVWLIVCVGTPQTLELGWGSVALGWLAPAVSLVGIVWMTNLFNFMDGVDGLAASESIMVGTIAGLLLLHSGSVSLGYIAILIASAAVGFLAWNRPPAAVFMGDVGSGFLGFVIGGLVIASSSVGAVPVLAWVTLLGVFVGDATITLFRRVIGRAKWYEPHRDHAYQRLLNIGWSHGMVTGAAAVVTAILAGLFVASAAYPELLSMFFLAGTAIVIAAYGVVERFAPLNLERRFDEPKSRKG